VTNPHPHPHPNPTDFAHEIRIRRMRILAGSVTSLCLNLQIPNTKTQRNYTCTAVFLAARKAI